MEREISLRGSCRAAPRLLTRVMLMCLLAGLHVAAFAQTGVISAWGWNGYGQIGDGTNTNRDIAAPVPGLAGMTQIAGMAYRSIAVKSDGTVWGWGQNSFGEIGDGTTTDRNSPVQVPGLTSVVQVGGGYYHSLAVKSDGTVWAWGDNTQGKLGDGSSYSGRSNVPVLVAGSASVTQVAGGYNFSLALQSNGSVWAWGGNEVGQLGNGTNTDSNVPVAVAGLSGVVQISAGFYHAMALKSDGTVWSWGRNAYGEVGDGSYIQRNVPVQVLNLTGVTQVSAGYFHSMALMADGTAFAWGYDNDGELGDGRSGYWEQDWVVDGYWDNQPIWVVDGYWDNQPIWTDGYWNNQPIWTDGYWDNQPIWVVDGYVDLLTWDWVDTSHWEDNWVWVDGYWTDHWVWVDGYWTDNYVWVDTSHWADNWVWVDTSYWADNWVWVDTSHWEDGPWITPTSDVPIQISSLSGFAKLAGGCWHSLALKTDGTVWVWGWNQFGQLGDGANTQSSVPVQVAGLLGQGAIVAGAHHDYSVAKVYLPTSLTISNVTKQLGQTLTLSSTLKTKGVAIPLASLVFSIDGQVIGNAVTNSVGKASLTIPNTGKYSVGAHTITVSFAGDSAYSATSGSATLTIIAANTKLTIGTYLGRPGVSLNLVSSLKRATDAMPIVGQSVTYSVDGNPIGVATTDGTGKATLAYKIDETLSLGAHVLTVSYAGDVSDNASTGTGTLNIAQATTKLVAGSVSGKAGATTTLKATLTRKTDSAPLAGRTVRFQIDGTDVGTGITNGSGLATLSYAIPAAMSIGKHPITALFDGEVLYLNVNATATLTVK